MLGTKSFLYLKNEGISRARLLTVLRHLGGEDCCSAIGARLELRRLRSTLPEQEALEPYTRDFLDELFRAQLEALSSVFLAYDVEKAWLPFYSHPFCDQNVMTGADLALISGCFSLPALALAVEEDAALNVSYCDAGAGVLHDAFWNREQATDGENNQALTCFLSAQFLGPEAFSPPFFLLDLFPGTDKEKLEQIWNGLYMPAPWEVLKRLAALLHLPLLESFSEDAVPAGFELLTPVE